MESLQVLIVDDESLVSQELVLMITQIGHSVVGVVSDGETALNEVSEKRPGVVLVDSKGPELNGIELTRQIMNECPTPVVVMVDEPTDDYAISAAEAGAFGYIAKPVTNSALIQAIAMAKFRFSDWIGAHEELTQLKETLETRKVAEQAKGIIMQRLQLPEAQAYAHLREKCRNQQKTMRQASIEIVEAERYFLDQLSKDPPSRMRSGGRWNDDRGGYNERGNYAERSSYSERRDF